MSDDTKAARMTPASTTREDVEGYAVCLDARGFHAEAATLRALLDERDALTAEAAVHLRYRTIAEAERDAARAEAARMREALADLHQIACALVLENARLLAALGLNAGWAQMPKHLLAKYSAALAGGPRHE